MELQERRSAPLETLLLIENDPAKRVALAMILRSFGYAVLEAGNRGEAGSLCSENGGAIQLAILDDDRSCEFVTRLQIVCPLLCGVLFISDASQPELSDLPCEFAFLKKPFRVDALADSIQALLYGPMKRSVTSNCDLWPA